MWLLRGRVSNPRDGEGTLGGASLHCSRGADCPGVLVCIRPSIGRQLRRPLNASKKFGARWRLTVYCLTQVALLKAFLSQLLGCPLIRKTQPYAKKIAHRGIWVEPTLLAEIEYRAKSAEGKLRHPFFKGIREDLELEARRP